MGKIKEGTNKYHTITTVLTDTFMGIHNYAYMNILMNTSFQKQNNLTGLQGPLSPCTDVIFSLISVLENTHYSEFFITFYAKILSKDILSYFIWRYTSFIVSLTMAEFSSVSLCSGRPYSQPSTLSEQEKANKGVRVTAGKINFPAQGSLSNNPISISIWNSLLANFDFYTGFTV